MGEAATPPILSATAEGTDTARLKEQLESLREELMRQKTLSDESLREQRFEWTEKMKQLEKQHQENLQNSREEVKRTFQGMLDSKEAELKAVRTAGASGIDVSTDLAEKQREIEYLKQHLMQGQQNEINDAFGLTGSDLSLEMAQLQHDYEELMIKCQRLEEEKGGMVPQSALTERDAFWQSEIQRLVASHTASLQHVQASMPVQQETNADSERLNAELETVRKQLEVERNQNEEIQRERMKLEEETGRLKQALQERDAVWQEELISSQTEQQELRTQYELVKVYPSTTTPMTMVAIHPSNQIQVLKRGK